MHTTPTLMERRWRLQTASPGALPSGGIPTERNSLRDVAPPASAASMDSIEMARLSKRDAPVWESVQRANDLGLNGPRDQVTPAAPNRNSTGKTRLGFPRGRGEL